jgi:phosphoribosylformylglycinamidine synthase subunit PurL
MLPQPVHCGREPVAATNNLNFGNPERPEIMAQLVEAIEGMAEACAFFETPITGGNVSLYNETLGEPIFPSPVLGIVGLMDDARTGIGFQAKDGRSVLLGRHRRVPTTVRFGGTQYAKRGLKELWGLPPALDMDYEKRVQAAVREMVREGLAESAHDLGDGGLAVAWPSAPSEPNRIGADVERSDSDLRAELLLFHEGPSRVVVSTAIRKRSADGRGHGVEAPVIGRTVRPVASLPIAAPVLLDGAVDERWDERWSALWKCSWHWRRKE